MLITVLKNRFLKLANERNNIFLNENVYFKSTDCGSSFILEHGNANFGENLTPVGESVPVICDNGYEVEGPDHITCQANMTWTITTCKIKCKCNRH